MCAVLPLIISVLISELPACASRFRRSHARRKTPILQGKLSSCTSTTCKIERRSRLKWRTSKAVTAQSRRRPKQALKEPAPGKRRIKAALHQQLQAISPNIKNVNAGEGNMQTMQVRHLCLETAFCRSPRERDFGSGATFSGVLNCTATVQPVFHLSAKDASFKALA